MLRYVRQYLLAIGLRKLALSVVIQLLLAFFLAHGYDFRVGYIAGRNIVDGLSPYLGGRLEGSLSAGYGEDVQGIGETPLWALYNGFAYFASSGHVFLFNLVAKLPVIAANIALSYLAYLRGCDAEFFLFNPFILLVTASWGKPDNIATLLAILPLTYPAAWRATPVALALSLMIKPLGLPLLPGYITRIRQSGVLRAIVFSLELVLLSLALFLAPFMLLGWPLDTVINGLPNWLKPAGGISPFNILETLTGSPTLPEELAYMGLIAPASILVLTLAGLLYPPADDVQALRMMLLGCMMFFSLRPWVSEQNLILVLTLIIFLNTKLPSKLLWILPLLFSVVNLSLFQQLYLIRPSIIMEMYAVDNVARLWAKFILSIAWLIVVWWIAYSRGMLSWRR